jgi:23S rRNA pseudouridine1911/1915/1917 synthase
MLAALVSTPDSNPRPAPPQPAPATPAALASQAAPQEYHLTVETGAAGQRLDQYLAERVPGLSRTRVQALIESGNVRLKGKPAQAAARLAGGDEIVVVVPPPVELRLVAQAIPLRIVYEDGDLLVIDKPAGLVVHPAPGHPAGTLVNALLAHCSDLAGIGGALRPGIVHRLDKETSGLMVVAKHDRAHQLLARQLKERQMDKRYLGLVDGGPKAEQGTVDAPIGRHPLRTRPMAVSSRGRPAITHFQVQRRYQRHTLLECRPLTGRTHQIRVHLAAIGCPIVGDRVYGHRQPTLPLSRHFLHAARLTFRLPAGETRTFEAPLPPDLTAVLNLLQGG